MADRSEHGNGREWSVGTDDVGTDRENDASRYARENYSSPGPRKNRPTKRSSREADIDDWERVLTPYDNRRNTEPRDPTLGKTPMPDKKPIDYKGPDHTMVMPGETPARIYGEPVYDREEEIGRRQEAQRERDTRRKEHKHKTTHNIKWSYLVGVALIILLLIMFFVKQ